MRILKVIRYQLNGVSDDGTCRQGQNRNTLIVALSLSSLGLVLDLPRCDEVRRIRFTSNLHHFEITSSAAKTKPLFSTRIWYKYRSLPPCPYMYNPFFLLNLWAPSFEKQVNSCKLSTRYAGKYIYTEAILWAVAVERHHDDSHCFLDTLES